jgi:hypothetical protein
MSYWLWITCNKRKNLTLGSLTASLSSERCTGAGVILDRKPPKTQKTILNHFPFNKQFLRIVICSHSLGKNKIVSGRGNE